MPLRTLFLTSIAVGLLIQGTLWRFESVLDQEEWARRIHSLEAKNLEPFRQPVYANPNAPLLFLGAVAHRLGASSRSSLYGGMSVLISLAAAGIMTITYALRPDIPWWLASGIIILHHHLFVRSTPQDAILAPLITLMILLILFLRVHPHRYYHLLFLGLVQGAALATRMPMSAVWIMGATVYMSTWLPLKTVTRVVILTIVGFFLFDPFMWFMPASHISTILSQASQHMTSIIRPETTVRGFFFFAPYAFMSIMLAMFFLLFQHKYRSPLPSSFVFFLLAMTTVIPSLILQAQFHSFRYFYSLIVVWDIFLPLYLLHSTSFISLRGITYTLQRNFTTLAQYMIVGLFFISFVLMQIYIYYLPNNATYIDWSRITRPRAQQR